MLKYIVIAISLATVLATPVDLENKLRTLLADEKHLSLKGLGVAVSARAVSASERDTLLRLHNDARNSVQPPAQNMPQMTWSSELASIAQAYADKCIWSHNADRSSQSSSFSYVGENIYVTTASTGYVESGVSSWVNEKNNYDYPSNSCSGVCGHYTQVVWAESTSLGCGVGSCPIMTNLPSYFTNTKFLVCNYGPGGNYVGEKPYVEGTGTGNTGGTTNTSGGCK